MKIAAIILIVLGALGLAYGGFSFTYPDKIVDVGPVELSVDKKKNIPLPPILGAVALAAGVGMLVVGRKRG